MNKNNKKDVRKDKIRKTNKRKNEKKKLNKKETIYVIIVSFVAALLSVFLGGVIGMICDSLYFSLSSLHFVLRVLIWLITIFLSYSISYLIFMIFRFKYRFFNIVALCLAYTFSVILVWLLTGDDGLLFISTYITAIAIIDILYILCGHISKKRA